MRGVDLKMYVIVFLLQPHANGNDNFPIIAIGYRFHLLFKNNINIKRENTRGFISISAQNDFT